MQDKNKVEVRIAGKEYKLCGIEEAEYIQKIALYVDRKMIEVIRSNSTLSTSMASVLTALNIADELQKLKKSHEAMEKEAEKSKALIAKLKAENQKLSVEKTEAVEKNTRLQLELAKREAELSEVRNSLDKATGGGSVKPRLHIK